MFLTWFLIGLNLVTGATPRQACNPAVVNYIVRDEKGAVLGEALLESMSAQLQQFDDATGVSAGQVSFAEDKKTFYWPESVEWEKGNKQPSLTFANAATCTMHLTEVTLTYHGKKMRLIFNIDIERSQADRRFVIDSRPFQEGTFKLDLKGWPGGRDQLVPSARWQRIASKAQVRG